MAKFASKAAWTIISPYARTAEFINYQTDALPHRLNVPPPRSMPSRISEFCLLPETAGTCAETRKPPLFSCRRSTPDSSLNCFLCTCLLAWVKVPCPYDHPNVARGASIPAVNAAVQQAGQVKLKGRLPSTHSRLANSWKSTNHPCRSMACWSKLLLQPAVQGQPQRSIKASENRAASVRLYAEGLACNLSGLRGWLRQTQRRFGPRYPNR